MAVPHLLHTVLDTDDVRGAAEFWRQLLRAYADPAGHVFCIFLA